MFVFSLRFNNHACVLPTFQFLYQNCIYLLLFSLHSNNHTLFIHSAETSVSVDEKKNIKEIYMSKKKDILVPSERIHSMLARIEASNNLLLLPSRLLPPSPLLPPPVLYYFHLFHSLHLTKSIGPSSASIRSPPINTFFLSPYCVQNPIIYFLRYFFFALKREFLIERYSKIHTSKKKIVRQK